MISFLANRTSPCPTMLEALRSRMPIARQLSDVSRALSIAAFHVYIQFVVFHQS